MDLISVFIPTHTKGRPEVAQNPIRLKNQLAAADTRLEELGWKPRDRKRRLDAARSLLEDNEFWEHQSDGLAVFIDEEGETTPVALSWEIEPSAIFMQVFLMRHLLPELGYHPYSILVLTRNAARLYELDHDEMTLQDVDLPDSFDDVNWFVDREKQRQQHPDLAGTDRSRHGHEPAAQRDEDTARFVRAVAGAIPDHPARPLIVLGDDSLVEQFVDVHAGESLSPPHSGVIDPDAPAEVRALAEKSIDQIEEDRQRAMIAELGNHIGAGRATTSIQKALPAAISGRLSMIAVQHGAPAIWGRFDELSFDVALSETLRPGDVDLVDRLVVEGRKTGADVHATTTEIDGSPFAAVFRF